MKLWLLKNCRNVSQIKLAEMYLFHFVILSQQSIRTVGDTHGDYAHAAYHHHCNIYIWKYCHDSCSYGGELRKTDLFPV